ncbi:MAG: hypothetical protein HN561_16320 [Candidatus Scalindua sp.]|nr:hypothetical protein [Candidatus Scalindua sp.]
MPEKSLNSLSGLLSTKDLPTVSMQKSSNKSLQGSLGENSFPAKLASSMKNPLMLKGQSSTLVPSKLNNMSSNEEMNHLMETTSISAPTNTETEIGDNEMQLNHKLHQNIPGGIFTSDVINNIPGINVTPEQGQINTLSGDNYLNNQGTSVLTEPSINLTKIVQDVARESYLGQSAANPTDKLNINQKLAKINEGNNIDIPGKPDLVKVAGEKAGLGHIFQESGSLNRQTLTLDVLLGSNKNTLHQQGPVSTENKESLVAPTASGVDTVSLEVEEGIHSGNILQGTNSPDTLQGSKAINDQILKPEVMFESGEGSNNRFLGHLTSPVVNKTVSTNPITGTLLQQGTVQVESTKPFTTQTASKTDTFMNTGSAPQATNNSPDTLQASNSPNGKALMSEALFEPREGSNNRVLDHLTPQVVNKTVSTNPITGTLLQQGTVQVKSTKPLTTQAASKSDTFINTGSTPQATNNSPETLQASKALNGQTLKPEVMFDSSKSSNNRVLDHLMSQVVNKTVSTNPITGTLLQQGTVQVGNARPLTTQAASKSDTFINTGSTPQATNNSQDTLQASNVSNGQTLKPEVKFESREGSNNRVLDHLISQVVNKTVSTNPITGTLLQKDTVQAKSSEPLASQAASKADAFINTGSAPQATNNSPETLPAGKAPNGQTLKLEVMFDSSKNSNIRVLDQLASQAVNRTVLIDPNTNTLPSQVAVPSENNETLVTPTVSNTDTVALRGESGINGNRPETIVDQAKTSPDNSFANNQSSQNIKESNINTGSTLPVTNNDQDTLQVSKVSDVQTMKPEVLFESGEGSNKIKDQLKEQYPDNSFLPKAETNLTSQQNPVQAKSAMNEAPKIFDVTPNPAEANIFKSADSVTSANGNSVNVDEAILQANTSSNNSSFGNQGADTLNEFYINPINARQKTETEINFTNTLSQINNPTGTLESLGDDIADNFIQKAKLFMQGGKSEIKLVLNPEELGNLKLEFTAEGDSLDAKITVERSAVKDVIEKDIMKLRELISHADIDVGKIDVFLQEKGDGRGSFMSKDLHSGSKDSSAQDFPNQDNEYFDKDIEEESMVNSSDSNQVNYLV